MRICKITTLLRAHVVSVIKENVGNMRLNFSWGAAAHTTKRYILEIHKLPVTNIYAISSTPKYIKSFS